MVDAGRAADAEPALPADDPDAIEGGRLLFARECIFLVGAVRIGDLPEPVLPEVAFAGRSNVGKSSLVNALTGRRTLARTSQTPGRTREINFFGLGGRLVLVDLPGYGYARVSRSRVREWTGLTIDYLRGRTNLRRVCLLVDSRHGLKSSDEEVMDLLDQSAVAYQVVLTKADKTRAADLDRTVAAIEATFPRHVAAHPRVLVTSAAKGHGIAALRAELAALAAPSQL